MNKKKFISLLLGGILVFSAVSSINTYASDDEIAYEFIVQSAKQNSRSKPRFRQTRNTDNQWKIRLDESGEGKGTITTFWLEVKDGTNVSKAVDIKQGNSAVKVTPKETANRRDVYLTAENNNFNLKSYRAKGIWDEETN